MSKYSSEFGSNEVSNSPTDSKTFNRDNVFWVTLINNTGCEIVVGDRIAGEIRVPSNTKIEFKGHPNFPTEINYKIRFNTAAPITDFITILTTQTNGSQLKQC